MFERKKTAFPRRQQKSNEGINMFLTFFLLFCNLFISLTLLSLFTVVIAVLGVKMVEKGFRALKEEHLHDYNARKANLDAAEKALWNEVSKYFMALIQILFQLYFYYLIH